MVGEQDAEKREADEAERRHERDGERERPGEADRPRQQRQDHRQRRPEAEATENLERVVPVEVVAVCGARCQVDEHCQKVALVCVADAVAAEHAMVVALEDADVADPAVEGTWWCIEAARAAVAPTRPQHRWQDDAGAGRAVGGEEAVEAHHDIEVDEETGGGVEPEGLAAIIVDVRQDDEQLKESNDVNEDEEHEECNPIARRLRHVMLQWSHVVRTVCACRVD